MNIKTEEKYVSIFTKAVEKKKNKQHFIENQGLAKMVNKKKVKLNEKQDEYTIIKNAEESQLPSVEIALNPSMNLEKLFSIQAIQRFLLWVMTKDQLNPMWFFLNVSNCAVDFLLKRSTKNKSSLKTIVVLSVSRLDASEFESYINANKGSFLAKYVNKNNYTRFKSGPFMMANEDFWLNILSTQARDFRGGSQQQESKIPKEIVKLDGKSQDQIIFERFEASILDKDELQLNLYPSKRLEAFDDFLETQPPSDSNNSVNVAKNMLGVDCEMVTTKQGLELARISIVDYNFQTVYDTFVKPTNDVLDYNTRYSGIVPEHLAGCSVALKDVQKYFLEIVNSNTILVGHSLENDLNALKIIHEKVIDTSVLFQSNKGFKNSLKTLAHNYLHLDIQKGTHNSIEDAKTALALAKFKVEILDNFETKLNNKPANLDVIDSLVKNRKSILPLDATTHLKTVLKYGTSFDEMKEGTFDEILSKTQKWLRMGKSNAVKAPDVIIARIRDLEALKLGKSKESDDQEDLEEGEFTSGEIKEMRNGLLEKLSKGIEQITNENKDNIDSEMFKKLVSMARHVRNSHYDARVNRKLIGSDKYNNRYYQYYDDEGRETKRIVVYQNKISEQEIDLNWDAWLRYRQKDPFTSAELNTLYEEQLKWQENAHAYEKEDSDMMSKFRKEEAQKHKAENPHTGKEQGQGQGFQPGEWRPGVRKNKDDI